MAKKLPITSNFSMAHHVARLKDLVEAGAATALDLRSLEHFMDVYPDLTVKGYEAVLDEALDEQAVEASAYDVMRAYAHDA